MCDRSDDLGQRECSTLVARVSMGVAGCVNEGTLLNGSSKRKDTEMRGVGRNSKDRRAHEKLKDRVDLAKGRVLVCDRSASSGCGRKLGVPKPSRPCATPRGGG